MDASRTPANHLEPKVKTAWRIQTAVLAGVLFVVTVPLSVVMVMVEAPMWAAAVAPVLLVAWAALWLGPITELRYRRWRWGVTDVEVRLQSGLIIIKRTVIPMARIQHVDTSQGPILRAFSLSEVRVWTAAGAHAIPALADGAASELRDRIAVLARVTDDGGL